MFAKTSKRDLYDAGQRYRSKWLDAVDDLDVCRERKAGLKAKLATRTSTAVRKLVVPPSEQTVHPSGISVGTAIAGGIGLVALGIVVGVLAAGKSQPSVVVAK